MVQFEWQTSAVRLIIIQCWCCDLINISVHRELVHAVHDAGLLPAWGHLLPARAVWAQQGKWQWLIYTFFCFPCASFVFYSLRSKWTLSWFAEVYIGLEIKASAWFLPAASSFLTALNSLGPDSLPGPPHACCCHCRTAPSACTTPARTPRANSRTSAAPRDRDGFETYHRSC